MSFFLSGTREIQFNIVDILIIIYYRQLSQVLLYKNIITLFAYTFEKKILMNKITYFKFIQEFTIQQSKNNMKYFLSVEEKCVFND